MSIKNIKPTNENYKQGYIDVSESTKYIGPLPVIFRSSWERKFAFYCENNDKIIKWSSEPFAIKYYNTLDKKFRTYYPDFYIKIDRGDYFEECVVEVKPKAQLKKPLPPKKKTKKAIEAYRKAAVTYLKNLCKKDALLKFAKDRKYKVMYITEDHWII